MFLSGRSSVAVVEGNRLGNCLTELNCSLTLDEAMMIGSSSLSL